MPLRLISESIDFAFELIARRVRKWFQYRFGWLECGA
jgi:hypothetical protein